MYATTRGLCALVHRKKFCCCLFTCPRIRDPSVSVFLNLRFLIQCLQPVKGLLGPYANLSYGCFSLFFSTGRPQSPVLTPGRRTSSYQSCDAAWAIKWVENCTRPFSSRSPKRNTHTSFRSHFIFFSFLSFCSLPLMRRKAHNVEGDAGRNGWALPPRCPVLRENLRPF